jgi:heme o synthase
LVLVLITFLWTPAHFWALALYRSDDYARVNVPMMPVVKGKASTRRQIFAYAIATFFAGLVPAFIGLGGPLYLGAAVLIGGWFVVQAGLVLRERDEEKEPAAHRLFAVSILYLFVLFAALICERLVGIASLTAASLRVWM